MNTLLSFRPNTPFMPSDLAVNVSFQDLALSVLPLVHSVSRGKVIRYGIMPAAYCRHGATPTGVGVESLFDFMMLGAEWNRRPRWTRLHPRHDVIGS